MTNVFFEMDLFVSPMQRAPKQTSDFQIFVKISGRASSETARKSGSMNSAADLS